MERIEKLTTGNYYHIFNRSIAGFKVFNDVCDFDHFYSTMVYYKFERFNRFSKFKELSPQLQLMILNDTGGAKLVSVVSYCLMPTHFHLLIKQNMDNGIVNYLRLIQNSYSKYFNILHKRKGPLWEGRFKAISVISDEQLLHLTRYIHLNPTSAGLVNKPQDWQYSSYNEFIDPRMKTGFCKYSDIIDMKPNAYKKFVDERKNYQQELSIIKSQLIDGYTG